MTKLFKFMGLGALASVLFFGTNLTAFADDPPTSDANAPAQKSGDRGWNNRGWGDGWKEKLGLTDTQSQQLKDLLKKQREETQALWDQIKVDMDTLKLKVDSKASDDDVKALLDKLSTEKKEMQVKREHFIEKSRGILTPTQQAKFLLEKRGRGGWGGREKWGRHGKMNAAGCEMSKACPRDEKGVPSKHKVHMKKTGDTSDASAPDDSTVPAGSGDTK